MTTTLLYWTCFSLLSVPNQQSQWRSPVKACLCQRLSRAMFGILDRAQEAVGLHHMINPLPDGLFVLCSQEQPKCVYLMTSAFSRGKKNSIFVQGNK